MKQKGTYRVTFTIKGSISHSSTTFEYDPIRDMGSVEEYARRQAASSARNHYGVTNGADAITLHEVNFIHNTDKQQGSLDNF